MPKCCQSFYIIIRQSCYIHSSSLHASIQENTLSPHRTENTFIPPSDSHGLRPSAPGFSSSHQPLYQKPLSPFCKQACVIPFTVVRNIQSELLNLCFSLFSHRLSLQCGYSIRIDFEMKEKRCTERARIKVGFSIFATVYLLYLCIYHFIHCNHNVVKMVIQGVSITVITTSIIVQSLRVKLSFGSMITTLSELSKNHIL